MLRIDMVDRIIQKLKHNLKDTIIAVIFVIFSAMRLAIYPLFWIEVEFSQKKFEF